MGTRAESSPAKLGDGLVWDRAKAELLVLGQRKIAIDAQTLCDYLDSLVGPKVAEVIMNNLEYRTGEADVASIRSENPQATIEHVIERLTEWGRLSGIGVTNVALTDNPSEPIVVEIWNPAVRGSAGAARAFLYSRWCGALSALLNQNLATKDVTYDEERSVAKCMLVRRSI
jgi:hypothetical protein